MSSTLLTAQSRQQAQARLRKIGARVTTARVSVLAILLNTQQALTHLELEHLLSSEQHIDRVTLYRVLDWLNAQHLAHKIAADDRTWRFNASQDGDAAIGQHAHFHCKQCQQIYCLNHAIAPITMTLPTGFSAESCEMNIKGLCAQCATSFAIKTKEL